MQPPLCVFAGHILLFLLFRAASPWHMRPLLSRAFQYSPCPAFPNTQRRHPGLLLLQPAWCRLRIYTAVHSIRFFLSLLLKSSPRQTASDPWLPDAPLFHTISRFRPARASCVRRIPGNHSPVFARPLPCAEHFALHPPRISLLPRAPICIFLLHRLPFPKHSIHGKPQRSSLLLFSFLSLLRLILHFHQYQLPLISLFSFLPAAARGRNCCGVP